MISATPCGGACKVGGGGGDLSKPREWDAARAARGRGRDSRPGHQLRLDVDGDVLEGVEGAGADGEEERAADHGGGRAARAQGRPRRVACVAQGDHEVVRRDQHRHVNAPKF